MREIPSGGNGGAPSPPSTEEGKAAGDLRLAGALAVAGSFLLLAVPIALFLFAHGRLFGVPRFGAGSLHFEGILAVVGAVLVLVALILYRRAFSHLKHADPVLRVASVLCLVGSVGALALVIAAAYFAGGSAAVATCVGGPATRALSCLRGADPAAGYAALAGFWLAWVGVVGLSTGLLLSGKYFARGLIVAAGVVYAILAADLLLPFVGLFAKFPGLAETLAIAPFAAVLGGLLVLVGAPANRSASG